MPTIFLDRDGVLNRKLPEDSYVRRWEEFELLPGVPTALARLKRAGWRLVLVTNQRGIARGVMSHEDLASLHGCLQDVLEASGARLDAIYYCPHDLGQCGCRKPQIGMFLE